MHTCILYNVYIDDNYVYMQNDYVYIITLYVLTQVKIYVVRWKNYVVMSLQGHRRCLSHTLLHQIWPCCGIILIAGDAHHKTPYSCSHSTIYPETD